MANSTHSSVTRSFFGYRRWILILTLVVLFGAGLGIRLVRLTDPPLDVHPTRQFHSALMARGMYYQTLTDVPEWQQKMAVQQWKREPVIEPPVMENLVAFSYKLAGGEYLWLARIISSIFWLLGGITLFFLARDLTNIDGGVVSLAFYLFLPYAVTTSRSFQPDPLMVSLITASLWAFNVWRMKGGWKWAITAGIISGLTLFVKNVSVFFLLIPFAAVILSRGLKTMLRSAQMWVLAGLAALPAAGYTLYNTLVTHQMDQQFNLRFFPNLWVTPSNYVMWFSQIVTVVTWGGFFLGLAGALLFKGKEIRVYILSLWAAYVLYGLTFAYHIGTHDYYQLPLVTIAAVSLAPLGSLIFSALPDLNPGKFMRPALGVFCAAALVGAFWVNWSAIDASDFSDQPVFWRNLGDKLRGSSTVALTQDYGYRLEYYGWDNAENWPASGDFYVRELAGKPKSDILKKIQNDIQGKQYFLVTLLDDFDRQPELKEYLNATYSVEKGDGYLIYDLSQP
jgi:4-amino-4-deoxy-L-arabinose transferase-like glycosyltransferase